MSISQRQRAPLTTERIVTAAMALAARVGETGVTMRDIAREAGDYKAMSLYHYVGGIEDVRALMLERIADETTAAAINRAAAAPPPADDEAIDPAPVARAFRRCIIENWAAGSPIPPGKLRMLAAGFEPGSGEGG